MIFENHEIAGARLDGLPATMGLVTRNLGE
jgi:hypothetical protein